MYVLHHLGMKGGRRLETVTEQCISAFFVQSIHSPSCTTPVSQPPAILPWGGRREGIMTSRNARSYLDRPHGRRALLIIGPSPVCPHPERGRVRGDPRAADDEIEITIWENHRHRNLIFDCISVNSYLHTCRRDDTKLLNYIGSFSLFQVDQTAVRAHQRKLSMHAYYVMSRY